MRETRAIRNRIEWRSAVIGTGTATDQALWPQFKAAKAHLRSLDEIERVFKRHILPGFGDRAADQITRSEITRLIDR